MMIGVGRKTVNKICSGITFFFFAKNGPIYIYNHQNAYRKHKNIVLALKTKIFKGLNYKGNTDY